MYVCMYACMHVCRGLNAWTHGWMYGCMDGRTDGWMDHGDTENIMCYYLSLALSLCLSLSLSLSLSGLAPERERHIISHIMCVCVCVCVPLFKQCSQRIYVHSVCSRRMIHFGLKWRIKIAIRARFWPVARFNAMCGTCFSSFEAISEMCLHLCNTSPMTTILDHAIVNLKRFAYCIPPPCERFCIELVKAITS